MALLYSIGIKDGRCVLPDAYLVQAQSDFRNYAQQQRDVLSAYRDNRYRIGNAQARADFDAIGVSGFNVDLTDDATRAFFAFGQSDAFVDAVNTGLDYASYALGFVGGVGLLAGGSLALAKNIGQLSIRGTVGASLATAYGADLTQASIRSMYSGEGTYTSTNDALSKLPGGRLTSTVLEFGIGGLAGYGVVRNFGAGQTTQPTRFSGNNGSNLLYNEFVVSSNSYRNGFEFNVIDNPGPLGTGRGAPASNFYGGRYNAITLDQDLVLYRAGNGGGGRNTYGQWFTRDAPDSVAQVRIDTAVREQWIDPAAGNISGTSPINAVYGFRIPKGTTIYEGPVAPQGGVYLGGNNVNQIYVPKTWEIKGHQIIFEGPLR